LRRRANQQPAFYRVHVEERNNLEFFEKKLLSKEKLYTFRVEKKIKITKRIFFRN